MQRINGGPLGKDLEVYLPGLQRGVFSAENAELLRATGTFYEPSILGTFLFIHIGILSFTLSRKRLSIAARSVLTIALILGLISLVFTGSRALYILTVFFFLYFFSYIKKVNFKAIKERAFPLAITSILVIMLTAPFILSRLNAFSEAFDRYGSATYRYQMILYSFRLGLQKPMGVGISHSPYYFATAFVGEDFIFDAAYPHNLFMHVFSETGIIGFSFFIVFLYFAYRKNLLARKVPNEFGIGSLLFLISAQFYPIFINHIEISYFFFLYLGLYIYSRNLPLNEKEK